MTLHKDWRKILKHAWSLRFILFAGLLTGLEGLLPLFDMSLLPPGVGYLLTFGLLSAAFIARMVAQSNLKD